jgi:acyl-[acyl-carrier-protein]-phospholipid O-acyltransferase/long-chain-fatty-acid--[acyl-carrier-protein] ligase
LAILGVMMADRIPAMLNYTASPETLETCVRKAKLGTIVTSRVFIGKAGIAQRPDMVFLEDFMKSITRSQRFFAALAAILLPRQELMHLLAPETHRDVFGTAVLLFSSGSTSIPKGVLLSHHNINSDVHCCLRIMGWTSKDSILGNLPLFHSFGMATCFWLPVMIGARVVNVPNPLDAVAAGEAVETHRLTIMLATPTFLQNYCRKCRPEQFASLRLVITGAEKLRKEIAERFRSFCGKTVIEGYGCTELSPIVSINIGNSFLNLGTEIGRPGSVGVPMPGICVKTVDPHTFEELPSDTEGLLLVKGPNVMQGYLDDPEKTDEVLIDGWYNTGDMAKIGADGYIWIVGRLSRFSKIGGEMVPHEMVEVKIYEVLKTDERILAVCGAPDPGKGERLIVYCTPDFTAVPQEIIGKLRESGLPNLWIPKPGNFYRIDSLPLLGSGKLDLKCLAVLDPERDATPIK